MNRSPEWKLGPLHLVVPAAVLWLLLAGAAEAQTGVNAFKVRSYGGKCLSYGASSRDSVLTGTGPQLRFPAAVPTAGTPVFLFDCDPPRSRGDESRLGAIGQQIVVEEINERHEVILRAGSAVVGIAASTPTLTTARSNAGPSVLPSAEIPLTLQSPNITASNVGAGQIFALDGDSIILASNRNLVVKVQNNRGANRAPLVLGPRELADNEFWDFVAADGSGRRPTRGFKTATDDNFAAKVSQSEWGTVIELNGDQKFNLGDREPILIPAGVTIRGDRRFTRFGPLLRAKNARDQQDLGSGIHAGMLQVNGDHVRITGLRLEGPSRVIDRKKPLASGIVAREPFIAIIDHNDLSDWTDTAVNTVGNDFDADSCNPGDRRDPRAFPNNIRVVRNFVHNNSNVEGNATGYGVASSVGGFPLIEGNTFGTNIHSIAGDGKPLDGFRARYNLSLGFDPGTGYDFDMHGLKDTCGQHCGGAAGNYIEIVGNTFLTGSRYNFKLRGTPCFLAEFHDNVSVQSLGDSIENHAEGNKLSVSDNNRFGVTNPTDGLGVGDIDGDGNDDLFLATGAAWYYSSSGASEWRYLSAHKETLDQLRLGDIDGDGRADVVTRRGGDLSVAWAGGSTWERLNQALGPWTDCTAADIAGDRRADIFCADGVNWYLSDGGVEPFKPLDVSSFRLADIRFGDFNTDGKMDVFGISNGVWSVAYGGASGWKPLPVSLTRVVSGLVVADLDGDGRADIATAELKSANNWQWSYSRSGSEGWKSLGRAPIPIVAAAGIGRFDQTVGADVLLWQKYFLTKLQNGSFPRHSAQDMR